MTDYPFLLMTEFRFLVPQLKIVEDIIAKQLIQLEEL